MDNGTPSYSTEAIIGVVGILGAVIGWVFRVVASAFTIGKRLDTFVTKDEVAAKYVTKEAFNEFKSDIKADLTEIKSEIAAEREVGEKRFLALMGKLGGE